MPSAPDLFPDVQGRGGRIDPGIFTVDESVGTTAPLADDGEPGQAFIGTSLSGRRLSVFFAALFLLLIGLAARAATLSLVHGAEYREQAEGNRVRVAPIPSERGVIYDRDGRLLVRNIPDFTLTVTPTDLPRNPEERAALIVRLAETVKSTPVEIEATLKDYPSNLASPVPVKEHLEYEQAVLMDIRSGTMPGVALKAGTKREILLSSDKNAAPVMSLSHVIGYEGRINEGEYARLRGQGYLPTDSIGKTGVEASYESDLRGTYGRKRIEVDAFGREQKVLAEDDPVQGKDLTLSIDFDLQTEAERALKAAAAMNGSRRASAVAMDPNTGEILALVSLPSYDANVFARGITSKEYQALLEDADRPLFPRAVAGVFPPGSTAKTMVAAAALGEGVVGLGTTVLSNGGLRIGQWFFPDWKPGGHGVTNIIKAIAESVNTFFYAVGGGLDDLEGLGLERLAAWFRRFGMGEKLGVDLPGEGAGFVPSAEWKERVKGEPWYIGDTYHLSIGQGDLLSTPLQAAAWTSVFANGGTLMRPFVVTQVRSDRNVIATEPRAVAVDVAEKSVIDNVRRGMRETVLSGSARSLQTSPWNIAGKTGTAQWKEGEPTHAWFTAFAPYEDPKIAVAVLIEAGGEGSRAAVPVARSIIETYLRSEKIPPARAIPAAPVSGASGTASSVRVNP